MTNKLNQRGFSVVEGLLVVIALTLVVGVGFYVVNANKDDDKTTEIAQTSSEPTKNESAKATQDSQLDPVAYVKGFYDEYLGVTGTGAQPLIDLAKKYGTQNFIDYVSTDTGGDPVLCGQQGKPQAKVDVSEEGESIIAKITYPSGQNPQVKYSVIESNGKLTIDSAACL